MAESRANRRRVDLLAFGTLAAASLCFVTVTRDGERSVVDAAIGRHVFLLGVFGIALAAVLAALISPPHVWKFGVGKLGRVRFVWIVLGWTAICVGFNATLNTATPPVAEEVLGSVFGWLLIEEFLFRGALFDLTDRLWAARGWRDPAVFVTALLFGLAHFQYKHFDFALGWFTVLYAIPTGVLFGYARRESDSIWPSVVLHAVANVVTQIVWVAVR